MATGEDGEKVMSELMNNQFTEMANIIWEVNFAEAVKNGVSLFAKVKRAFQSNMQSAQSANITQDTILPTSIKEVSKTEGSPTVN